MKQTGVLLVNLGTPDSEQPNDVRRYLTEFLTDGRVIDQPFWKREILVRSMIVPWRYKQSAKSYARIWTTEGSPLKYYGFKVRDQLQISLGDRYDVQLAMRYQNPSIASSLEKMEHLPKLVVLPLFPQYASATTGSVHQKVMEVVSRWTVIPEIRLINSYPIQPEMISAFSKRGAVFPLQNYDHVLFSFHGLPEKHIRNADKHQACLSSLCCQELTMNNGQCYSAQCHATARAIANQLSLDKERFSVSFQSRLGNDPWLKPYTIEILAKLLKQGKKRVLVYSPSFVSDCLETLDEIGYEYRQNFIDQGGEALDLVP